MRRGSFARGRAFDIRMRVVISIFLSVVTATSSLGQWTRIPVETKTSLRGLSVVNENIIWASGTDGTFLNTVDGGKNWTVGKISGAENLDFRDIEAFDANTAYVLSIGNGDSSRIYKTSDGGKSWRLQFKNTNEKAFFDALAFSDSQNGIAMSDPVEGFYFLIATNNGGETWKRIGEDKMPRAINGEAAFAASGTCLITQGA